MWDEITYLFPNLNGCTVEVLEWIDNFISLFLKDVVTYPYWDTSLIMLVKGAADVCLNSLPKNSTARPPCFFYYLTIKQHGRRPSTKQHWWRHTSQRIFGWDLSCTYIVTLCSGRQRPKQRVFVDLPRVTSHVITRKNWHWSAIWMRYNVYQFRKV